MIGTDIDFFTARLRRIISMAENRFAACRHAVMNLAAFDATRCRRRLLYAILRTVALSKGTAYKVRCHRRRPHFRRR